MSIERNGMNGTEEPISTRGLAERLRRVGQRVTPQRLVILGALRPGEHLAADEVFSRVEPLLPGVNRSTVYRTLELFRDLGLVSMTDLGGGARQFELIDDLHHHLICHRCGAILELDDALVDPLRDGIRAREEEQREADNPAHQRVDPIRQQRSEPDREKAQGYY